MKKKVPWEHIAVAPNPEWRNCFLETIAELNLKRYFKHVPRYKNMTSLENCKEWQK